MPERGHEGPATAAAGKVYPGRNDASAPCQDSKVVSVTSPPPSLTVTIQIIGIYLFTYLNIYTHSFLSRIKWNIRLEYNTRINANCPKNVTEEV